MNELEAIPYGHSSPMPRPADAYKDRALRKKINDANNHGDCIINNGNGYYRPVPGDPVDESELELYLAKELHRAREILKKRLSMRKAFFEMSEAEVLKNGTSN